MSRNLTIKAAVVAAVLLLSLVYLVPTMGSGRLPAWWTGFMPAERLHLGLDLQGGMHLILEVDVDKAVQSAVERTSQDLRRKLAGRKNPGHSARSPSRATRSPSACSAASGIKAKVQDLLAERMPDYALLEFHGRGRRQGEHDPGV